MKVYGLKKKSPVHCAFMVFTVLSGEKKSYLNSEVFNIRPVLFGFDECFKAMTHKVFVASACLNRMSVLGVFIVAP